MITNWRTPLDAPLILFLASAGVGVWASYDPAASWQQFGFIAGAILLFSIIARLYWLEPPAESFNQPFQRDYTPLLIFVWSFLFFSAFLALFFVTQHPFSTESAKFSTIERVGVWLNQLFPRSDLTPPHQTSVAGILEIALPLNIALLWQSIRHARWISWVAAIVALVIAFGLLMTSSRGAWIALGTVGLITAGAYWQSRRHVINHSRVVLPITFILLVLSVPFVLQFVLPGWQEFSEGSSRDYPRALLFQQVIQLTQDYILTGAGLGTFKMVHSTYYLLIQNGLLPHAHNLFLQIWFEQGLLGICAFGWSVIALYGHAWRKRNEWNVLAGGGLAATTVLLLHGLTDVPFWYSQNFLIFLFLPLGVTVGALGDLHATKSFFVSPRALVAITATAVVASGLFIATMGRSLASLWYANLGNVAQTKLELSRYNFPDVLVEYVRRSADYTEPQAYWERALTLDPGSISANQRWGQVLLARGEYARAAQLFEAAYARDSSSSVTWQLLGAAYLGLGRMDDAHQYWVRLPNAVTRLESEAWVRYETQGDKLRAGWAMSLARRILQEQSAHN